MVKHKKLTYERKYIRLLLAYICSGPVCNTTKKAKSIHLSNDNFRKWHSDNSTSCQLA